MLNVLFISTLFKHLQIASFLITLQYMGHEILPTTHACDVLSSYVLPNGQQKQEVEQTLMNEQDIRVHTLASPTVYLPSLVSNV